MTLPVRSPVLTEATKTWRRELESAGKSKRTIDTYVSSVVDLDRFLADDGNSPRLGRIERAAVARYFADLRARSSPATVSTRYKALHVFFEWARDVCKLASSPMSGIDAPELPDIESAAELTRAQIKRLLRSCEGTRFADRRDSAIIRLFLDTGMRRTELASLTIDDIDFSSRLVHVVAQGHARHDRECPVGANTASAFDLYLDVRDTHRHAHMPNLWIGKAGALTENGVQSILTGRGRQAQLDHLSARQLRYTFVREWLMNGGSEADLMILTGWQSPQSVARYSASAPGRAQQSHRRLALSEHW
jgi:integrase/recombinase XerC